MNCHRCSERERPRMIVKSSWKSKLIKSLHGNLYSNHYALSIFHRKVKNWRKKTHTHTDPQTNTDRMDFQYLTDRKQNMWHYTLCLPLPSPVSTLLTFHAASLFSISVFLMNWRISDHSCTITLTVLVYNLEQHCHACIIVTYMMDTVPHVNWHAFIQ